MSSEVKTRSKNLFLKELAALMDKYKVALCSRNTGEYSEVFFQIHDKRKGKSHYTVNIETGRTHSSSYEINCLRKRL